MSQEQNHMCDLVEMFALGGLSPEEARQFEQHLQQCESCQKEFDGLQNIVDLLPLSVPQQQAPSGMKQRILQNVLESKPESNSKEPAKRRSAFQRYRFSAAVAAAIILLVYSAAMTVQYSGLRALNASHQRQIDRLQSALAQQGIPNPNPMKLEEAVKLNPAAENIVAQGLATIVIDSKGTHLLVQAENLPKLQGTEAYQVWLMKDGQPTNAGTFLPSQGKGALYFTFEDNHYDQIAISLEPDAKGTVPRGKVILVSSVKG